jgi:hypothetical protein
MLSLGTISVRSERPAWGRLKSSDMMGKSSALHERFLSKNLANSLLF